MIMMIVRVGRPPLALKLPDCWNMQSRSCTSLPVSACNLVRVSSPADIAPTGLMAPAPPGIPLRWIISWHCVRLPGCRSQLNLDRSSICQTQIPSGSFCCSHRSVGQSAIKLDKTEEESVCDGSGPMCTPLAWVMAAIEPLRWFVKVGCRLKLRGDDFWCISSSLFNTKTIISTSYWIFGCPFRCESFVWPNVFHFFNRWVFKRGVSPFYHFIT